MVDNKQTKALQKAKLKIDPITWLRCFPLEWGIALLFSAFPWIVFACGFMPLVQALTLSFCMFAGVLLYRYLIIAGHCRNGIVNPAIVVSTNPYLIAVYMDFNTGGDGEAAPIFKIVPQPLEKAFRARLEIGNRLAAISVFNVIHGTGNHVSFFPIAVQCVTNDQQEIGRIMSELPVNEDVWDLFERAVKRYANPPAPGQYVIPRAFLYGFD